MSKKKFGDRRDARRVDKDIDPLFIIATRIVRSRADSDIYLYQKVDITDLVKYMGEEKKKSPDNYPTFFHIFCFALAKTMFLRPKLNRYIKNYKTYQRDLVSIGYVAKGGFEDSAREFLSNITMDKSYTLEMIKSELTNQVKKIRNSGEESGTDKLVSTIAKMPSPIVNIFGWALRFMDKHDWLPQDVCDSLIYYSSCIVSNIGVLQSDAVYHCIADFGTNSFMVMIGEIKEEYVFDDKGKPQKRSFVTFGVNVDQRLADGFYLIKSIKVFESILANPKLLAGTVGDSIAE